MRMAIKDSMVWVADAPPSWTTAAKKSGQFRGDRKSGMLYGIASLRTLEMIREATGRLPPPAEELRLSLISRQRAVEAERAREEPKPIVDYPVKRKLFAHQVRGANMALLTLGIVSPEEGR